MTLQCDWLEFGEMEVVSLWMLIIFSLSVSYFVHLDAVLDPPAPCRASYGKGTLCSYVSLSAVKHTVCGVRVFSCVCLLIDVSRFLRNGEMADDATCSLLT